MAKSRKSPVDWFPDWIGEVDSALWITNPHGTIAYLNPEAESLLGHDAAESLGKPCYRILKGRDGRDRPICSSFCAVRMLAANHARIEPVTMRVPGAGGRWIEVTAYALTAPDGSYPWLVHWARDTDLVSKFERLWKTNARKRPA